MITKNRVFITETQDSIRVKCRNKKKIYLSRLHIIVQEVCLGKKLTWYIICINGISCKRVEWFRYFFSDCLQCDLRLKLQ